MPAAGHDSLGVRRELKAGDASYDLFSLEAAAAQLGDIARLPFSLKVLLENLLRFEDGRSVTVDTSKALVAWLEERRSDQEIAYPPGARADAGLHRRAGGGRSRRDARGDASTSAAIRDQINPLSPVDLVIDHSVQVDDFGNPQAFQINVEREYERNGERYAFLRWGQDAFDNFRVVPPGTGICHQVNLEYLGQVVWTAKDGNRQLAYPRHAGRHRQPHHHGQRPRRARLGRRRHRGRGGDARPADLDADPRGGRLQAHRQAAGRRDRHRPRADRDRRCCARRAWSASSSSSSAPASTICRSPTARPSPTWRRNTAPPAASSRSTRQTLDYLRLTGRDGGADRAGRGLCQGAGHVARRPARPIPCSPTCWSSTSATVEPSLAGPKRPQDRVALSRRQGRLRGRPAGDCCGEGAKPRRERAGRGHGSRARPRRRGDRRDHQLHQHLEPQRHARRRPGRHEGAGEGLKPKPWVKTSLAPGSRW